MLCLPWSEPVDDPSRHGRARRWVMLAAMLSVVAISYSNALEGPFVWDDRMLVESETLVRHLSPRTHLFEPFWRRSAGNEGDATYYRPLTTLSYAVNWALSGCHPGPFHATNVLLHFVACALVFALALRAGAPPVGAALGAAAFGVLPRLTESVTWVSGRTDVLATVLALSALALHLSPRARGPHRWAAAAAIFLGLLSKEVAAAALAGIVAAEGWSIVRGRALREATRRLFPATLASAVYGALRFSALHHLPPPPHDVEAPLAMPFQALGEYVTMLLDPLRPRLQIGILGQVEPLLVAFGLAATCGIGAALVVLARRRASPSTVALVVTAIVSLALVMHIVPIRLNVIAADRFLYLPAATLAILGAGTVASLGPRRRRIAAWATALALPVLMTATLHRNEDWGDELRLWRVAVDTSPSENWLPRHELANVLARTGRGGEALEHYNYILARTHKAQFRIWLLADVAGTLSDLGRFEEALGRVEEVVALDPDRPVHHYNLGLVESRLLRFADADREFERALALFPRYEEAARARAIVADAARQWAALPPEEAREPTSLRARRAALWTKLNAPSRAVPLWVDVIARPDAAHEVVLEAAAYLVTHADRLAAETALRRAESEPSSAELIASMREVISERFEDGTAQGSVRGGARL